MREPRKNPVPTNNKRLQGMNYRELGERAGIAFWTPPIWAWHMWEAHFRFVDELLLGAEMTRPQLKVIEGNKR